MYDEEDYLDNYEVAEEVHRREADDAEYRRLRYAEGSISREMLVNRDGSAKTHSLDIQIADAYKAVVADLEKDREHFSIGGDGELRSADGRATYISRAQSQAHADAVRKLNASAGDRHSRVYAESDLTQSDLEQLSTVKVHGDFYRFLAALPSWEALADGRFERAMAIEMNRS